MRRWESHIDYADNDWILEVCETRGVDNKAMGDRRRETNESQPIVERVNAIGNVE